MVDNYFSVDDKSEFIGCIDVIEAINTVTTFTTLDIHNSYRLVTYSNLATHTSSTSWGSSQIYLKPTLITVCTAILLSINHVIFIPTQV